MSFIVYKASAGSGKTFNLAKEYLKIVLQNPDDFKHILAITFTNKAANEMKTRILDYLHGISSSSPDGKGIKDLLPLLITETGLSENEIKVRSGMVLRKILYRYADFSIMTIDKFFQKIIRSFSYDLNIPINYRLEINIDDMVEQIVDNLIDLVGENQEIGEILIQYINKLTQDNKSWHIEKNLVDFSKEIFKEKAYFNLKSLKDFEINDFIKTINDLKIGLNKISKDIESQAKTSCNLIESIHLDRNDFSYKQNGVGQWFYNVLDGNYSVNSYATKAIYEESWFPKNKEPDSFAQIKLQLSELGINIVKRIREHNDLSIIFSGIYGVALVNQIKNVIQKVKDQEGMFFLSETNFTLSDVIKNQPTPFVYERIGEKYHHYFIDEFQDTSKLQWSNMVPLIIEAISSLHDGKSGSAILFGDAKQSIYRFRDADFSQFVQLPKIDIEGDEFHKKSIEQILSSAYKPLNLSYNYRTKAQVVEFNNQLFELAKEYIPNYAHLYENHSQSTVGNSDEGFVEINLLDKSNDEIVYLDEVNQRILSIIHDLIAANYEYKDIAILGRDKNNLRKIATFLISNSVRVISSDSLQLDTSADVRLLKQMIHYFKSNNDELNNASIIRYLCDLNPKFKFAELISASKQTETMQRFFASLGYTIDFKVCFDLNIYDLSEEMIRIFFKNKIADSYIMGFLDIIHKYHLDQKSESEFSTWWEDEKDNYSIALPEGIDGVKILTVHAAKGLEYPIVIIPNFKQKIHPSTIWVKTNEINEDALPFYNLPTARVKVINSDSENPDLVSCFDSDFKNESQLQDIDQLNISYVALTRAIDRLYILSERPSDSSLKKPNYDFSKLLHNYTNLHPDYQTQIDDDSFSHYQIGTPISKKIKALKQSSSMVFLHNNVSTQWYNSKNFSYNQPETEAMEWGNIFHYAIQFVLSISDIENALIKTKQHFNLSEEKIVLVKLLIESTCNNILISKYFTNNNKVLNERSIVDSNGDIFRPDRIILQDNIAIVLDFKTGIAKEIHQEQIYKYKNLITEIGFEKVKSFVVYVQLEKVEVVEYQ